jgi:calcineurin-like phosphoesterase family protein
MGGLVVMTFFTADLHIGHANIIKHCSRPFSSVEDMDATLIEDWNACVRPEDDIYIIGDLFVRNHIDTEEYLQRLNGRKYLIVGNHDKEWMRHIDLSRYFAEVSLMSEIVVNNAHKVTMCHYPMMEWLDSRKGTSYMIHGHIHSRTDADYFTLIRDNPNMLNAGVDVNGFKPVTFNELIKNNRKLKENSRKGM